MGSRKPGIVAELPDNRLVIVYEEQPLLEQKGKVILNLTTQDHELIIKDGKPSLLIWDVAYYNLVMEGAKFIGFVD